MEIAVKSLFAVPSGNRRSIRGEVISPPAESSGVSLPEGGIFL